MADTLFDPPPKITEKRVYEQVSKALRREDWLIQHVYRMRTESGAWRTSTTASGFPDIFGLRPPWVLACELKGPDGRVEPDQITWLEAVACLPWGLAWVLRPRDDPKRLGRWISRPEIAPRVHGWTPTRPLWTPLSSRALDTSTPQRESTHGNST